MAAYNNPSPWGAFAEGIAGGVNAGTQGYLQGRQLLGQEQQRAETIDMQKQQLATQKMASEFDMKLRLATSEGTPDEVKKANMAGAYGIMKKFDPTMPDIDFTNLEYSSDIKKAVKGVLTSWDEVKAGKKTIPQLRQDVLGWMGQVGHKENTQFNSVVRQVNEMMGQKASEQVQSILSGTLGYADKERTQPIAGMTDQEIKQGVGALSQYLPTGSIAYEQAKDLLVPKEEKATGVGTTNDGWTVFFDPSKKAQMATKLGSPPVYYDTNAHGVLPSSEKTKVTVAIQGAEARGESFAKNRWYDVYDKEKGQIVKKQGKDLNANPDRYVSPSEPLVGSLKNQEKVYGMMGGFVNNLNKQISAIDGIMAELNRTGIRAVDMPLREIRMRLKGSGQEKVLESYLAEISREIGKLSTGSTASIAELSVDAQKKWDKIHDPNLPMGELKLILNATKEQANMRLSSSQEQIKATHERLGFTPSQTPPPETPKSLTSGSLPNYAVSKLKEDVITTFENDQQWMLKNGKPVRLK